MTITQKCMSLDIAVLTVAYSRTLDDDVSAAP